MSDTTIPTTPGAGGPTLDAEQVTRSDGTVVVRERDRIAGELPKELADVKQQAPTSEEFGVVTRVAGMVQLDNGQFETLATGQRQIIALLEQIVDRI